jgi:putative phage-type endonuclease
MKIHNVEQGSQEWFKLREQYPLTASKAQAIGNSGKGLETLCWTKISEKYSFADKDNYANEDLERGTELEPLAKNLYELKTHNTVTVIGFVTDEKISTVGGASPDGLVNEDGLIEIKAFADTKHFKAIIDFKKTGKFEIESQYEWQMQQQMLFTGRKWCDFVAYNPNYKESLLIQRVEIDEDKQSKLKEGLKQGEIIIKEIENNYAKI